MKYNKEKRGISLIVLVITIIIAVILLVATMISLDSNVKDSKLSSFAYEILNIEDAVKSYYIMYDELPLKDNEQYSYNDMNDKLNISMESTEIENEIENLGDETNNTFFVIDFSKLEIDNIKETDGKIYVCSFPNFNVYYVEGITVKGIKYHSITSKIDERIVKKVTKKNEESSIGSSTGVQLAVSYNNSTWTNKLGIIAEMKNYQDGDYIYCNGNQIPMGQEFNSLSDLGIIGENNTLTFTVKRDDKEIAKEEIDISNFDDMSPEIDKTEIIDEYVNMDVLEITGIKDNGNSGLKELRYEVITEDNINKVEEILNSEFLIKKGKIVELSNIELDSDGKGTVMIKLPKEYLGICFLVIDKASNISTSYIYSSNRVMCTITTSESSPTTAETITYNLKFSEEVDGFEQSDIIVKNGEIESFSGSGAEYTVKVKSIEGQKVVQTLTVPENVCTGTSQINRNIGNLASSLTLVVDRIIKPQSILLNKSNITMAEKETINLIATVLPNNTGDKSVIWSSSNESVATVDQNGKVTALNEGETSIIVTCTNFPNISAKCQVTVKSVVAKIGEKYYTDLQNAFDDASTDSLEYSTIEILRDFSVDSEKELEKEKYAIIDLKGYTISTKDVYLENSFFINSGSLKITSSVDGGMILSDNARYNINNKGNLEITNVTIKNTGANNYCVYSSVSSSFILDSGKLETTNSSGAAVYLANSMATVTQNGGEIAGNILNNGVYNLNNGTTKQISNNGNFIVEGGNISETFFQYTDTSSCIVKDGTIAGINITNGIVTLGEDDGTVSITSPQVTSLGVNIYDTAQFNFYDGIIRGNGNAIVGTVTKKAAKHYIQKTKDSTTNIETAILSPGNSVDDIAYVYVTEEARKYYGGYRQIWLSAHSTGDYYSTFYSSVTSEMGSSSNESGCTFLKFKFKFYDKDKNELTNIYNDSDKLKMGIKSRISAYDYTVSEKYPLEYAKGLKDSYSKDMPAKFVIISSDDLNYVAGLDYCYNVADNSSEEIKFSLPTEFSFIEQSQYFEKYAYQEYSAMAGGYIAAKKGSYYGNFIISFYLNNEKVPALDLETYPIVKSTNVWNTTGSVATVSKEIYDSVYSKFETEFRADTGRDK